MASFDAQTSGSIGSGSSVLTISHTCAANSSLLVAVTLNTAQSISSAEYNGSAMTFLNQTGLMYVYGVVSPASGAHDVVITMSGSLGVNESVTGMNASFTERDTTNTFSVVTGEDGACNSTDIVTIYPSTMLCSFISQYSNTFSSNGSGQTQMSNLTAAGSIASRSSYKQAGTSAGTETMSYGTTPGDNGDHIIVSIKTKDVPFTISETVTTTEVITMIRTRIISVLDTVTTTEVVTLIKELWRNVTKNTIASFVNTTKNIISPTNTDKNSINPTNTPKS